MEKIDEQQKLQQLLAQLSANQELGEALNQQLASLSRALTEVLSTIESLKALKGVEPGCEMLVPIGHDSFVKAGLASNDRVLIGLGANVVVERTADETVEILKSRAEELERVMEQTGERIRKLEEKIEEVRPQAESLIQKLQEEEAARGKNQDV